MHLTCIPCAPGTATAATGQTECQQCTPGRFNSVSGSLACDACPAGTFTSATGAIACAPCLGSTYSLVGSSTCQMCSTNQVPNNEHTGCVTTSPNTTTCLEGQEWSTQNQRCVSCAAGSYSPSGVACALCPLGRYSHSSGSALCTLCSAGYYSPAQGQATCTRCQSNMISRQEGSIMCEYCTQSQVPNDAQTNCVATNCGAGSYAPLTSVGCQLCPPGTHQNRSGESSCVSCPTGKFSSLGAISCTNCAKGTFGSIPASTQCQLCPAGSAALEEGAVTCQLCEAGTFSFAGSDVCKPCDMGEFSPIQGVQECLLCKPGTYANTTGSASCKLCPPGSYSNTDRSAYCTPCPVGFANPLEGASSCLGCPQGYEPTVIGSPECLKSSQGSLSSSTMCVGNWCNIAVIVAAVSTVLLVMCGLLALCHLIRNRASHTSPYHNLSRAGSPTKNADFDSRAAPPDDQLGDSRSKEKPILEDSKVNIELSKILKDNKTPENPEDVTEQSFRSSQMHVVPENEAVSDESDHHVDVHKQPLKKKKYPPKKSSGGVHPLRSSTSQERLV
eukprot:TRINITY_DN8866_c0_g1_i3.p1 TRINITY_DN8866_c0_g1~~TRINITY_DN8866_c0_g1_i3.p1  ORF type:complete len:558 (+),score=16.34 TRINITY_DN8866_c0_g1_i3:145-1818(+)